LRRCDDLFGGAGSGLDVDLNVGNGVLCEEAFAVRQSRHRWRVDDQFHSSILADSRVFIELFDDGADSKQRRCDGAARKWGGRAAIIGTDSEGWGRVIAQCEVPSMGHERDS